MPVSRYVVEDPSTRRFEIDETALPFWENREGHTIVGPATEPGEESNEAAPAESTPEESGTAKPSKAAKPAGDK